jgi:LPS export ABC transporter protein LptC
MKGDLDYSRADRWFLGRWVGALPRSRGGVRWRAGVLAVVLAAIAVGAVACGGGAPEQEDTTAGMDEFEGDLVFANVTLNRSDGDGKLLWEVTAAEARYSRDRRFAQLLKPTGKLYEGGELVYEVSAERGEVEANGEVLRLRGKIRALDVRDRVRFEGQEASWQPQAALFDVTKGLKVSRDDVVLTAGAGKASSRDRRIELLGKTRTVSKKQGADFKAERLVWLLEEDRVDAIGAVDGLFNKVAASAPGTQNGRGNGNGAAGTPAGAVAPNPASGLGDQRQGPPSPGETVGDQGVAAAPSAIAQPQPVQSPPQLLSQGPPAPPPQRPPQETARFKTQRLTWLRKLDRLDAIGAVNASFVKRNPAGRGPQEQATLVAQRLTWLRREGMVHGSGQVQTQGTGSDGAIARVLSNQLTWNQTADLMDARGNVQASGVEPDGTPLAMTSDRAIWRRKDDILDALGNVKALGSSGEGSPVQLAGNRVVWQRRSRILQAMGNVVALSQDPPLRTQTERLVWQLGPKLVQSDTRTLVEVLDCNGAACQVTQRAAGDRADMDLKGQTAFLRGNAQVSLTDPAVDVLGESLAWQMRDLILTADQPVTAIDREQGVVLRGDRGTFNGKSKLVDLIGQVRGTDQRRGAQLRSNRLIWAIEQQVVQALGQVFYQQSDPPMTSTGDQMFGQIKDGAISLYGGPGGRARSTFIHEEGGSASNGNGGDAGGTANPGAAPGTAPGAAGPAPGGAPVPAGLLPDSNPLPPIPPSLLRARAEAVLLPPELRRNNR